MTGVQTCALPIYVFPTVLEAVGETCTDKERRFPGKSLFSMTNGDATERTAFSEYHGMGSSAAAFMVRRGRYKYIYYVAYPEQLFDLEVDPEERVDLAQDARYRDVVKQYHNLLLSICDPVDVDRRAKRRQAEQLARYGGRDAVIARGDLGFSPPPGIAAEFN